MPRWLNRATKGATMGFNAETYWADKPVKKFSIVLRNGTAEQNMIVAARNEDAARAAALENTFLDASAAVVVSAQLATPEDLGLSTQPDHSIITERDLAAENTRLRAALSDCVDMMQQCQHGMSHQHFATQVYGYQ